MDAKSQPTTLLESLLDEVEASAAPDASQNGHTDTGIPDDAPRTDDTARAAAGAADSGESTGTVQTPPLSNDVLAALPTLLKLMGTAQAGTGSGAGPAAPPHRSPDRHTALLKALKPYLSPARKNAVETLLSLVGMWDTVSVLGAGLLKPHGTDRSDRPVSTVPAEPVRTPEGGDR